MVAVRYCLKIRNQYAHCHYSDQLGHGLFLTTLGAAADAKGDFEYLWLHIDVPLLDKQEQYFLYTVQCLQYLHEEYRLRSGKSSVPFFFQWPKALPQPPKHNLLSQHIPPWLGEQAQRRHAERAAELEQASRSR
jgi:hypothetical protein